MGKIIGPDLLTLNLSAHECVSVEAAVPQLVERLPTGTGVSGSRPDSYWSSAEVSLNQTLNK